MTAMKFRQLIDVAIGSPEPGHVNFLALHCLLTCIAEKLGIADEIVEYSNNVTEAVCCCNKGSNYDLLRKSRLLGGTNPDEENTNNDPTEPPLEPEDSANADVTPAQDLDDATLNMPSESKIMQNEIEDQIPEQEPVAEVLSPTTSKGSTKSHTKSLSSQLSADKQNERISDIEMSAQRTSLPIALTSGIAIMKDQLEFVMEQLLLLTFLTLSKKPDTQQIQILHSMAQALREIKKDNIYIQGLNRLQLPTVPSLNWQSSGLQLNEDLSENDILETQNNGSAHTQTIEAETVYQDVLEGHLCYSPEKLLDQMMQLKSEFCHLANKLNELSAYILEQESHRTLGLIHEIQEQIRDIKLSTINLKDTQSRLDARISSNQNNIENMKVNIEELLTEKADKTHMEIQLASKVDYDQLQRKVSLDQLLELQCRIDKKFCEVLRQINENYKNLSQTIDNLNETLGFAAIDGILKTFKENITKDVQTLHELLKTYIESTNDECAAAGTRIKVLQDLACLSCDTNCVMRTMEKAKVAKLPSAHASNILSPLITYELGSIRKSGIMGYYRKDEFPHATNAWLARQSNVSNEPNQCFPRHAGGQHTTNNAKERVEKMSNRK